ncbi:MAG: SDR family NAD(P)-dependent oxidoreductase [Nitrococcus mobilis]|nr:SDR family NAD(P)-dependent oxidoreductase [Nitrococcus mobilis]
MGKLDGKVAVVTGASRGLGEAIVAGFAAEGAAVVLAARTRDDLDRVATACRQAGPHGPKSCRPMSLTRPRSTGWCAPPSTGSDTWMSLWPMRALRSPG